MEKNQRKFLVLDAIGNPLARKNASEANPFVFYSLREAFKFAEEEIKEQDAVNIVEINEIDRFGSGM